MTDRQTGGADVEVRYPVSRPNVSCLNPRRHGTVLEYNIHQINF